MPSLSSLALFMGNCTIEQNESHVSRRGVGNGNAIRDYRWPNQTIPYYFDTQWKGDDLAIAKLNVKIATDELAFMVSVYGGVNLTFIDTTNTPTESKAHHLKIFKVNACSATVGYRPGAYAYYINIGAMWCFSEQSFVKHEFGHVLGLWHEQQHPVATRYVTRVCDIGNSCKGNCNLRGRFMVTTSPYDFSSIMHYGLGGCDGMKLTALGKELLKAQKMDEHLIGAGQNYSVHDGQMIAAEYSDEMISDRSEYCSNLYDVPKCGNFNDCIRLDRIGDSKCDPELRCYYLDGGDCDTMFSPFGIPDHTITYVTEESHHTDHYAGAVIIIIVAISLGLACIAIAYFR